MIAEYAKLVTGPLPFVPPLSSMLPLGAKPAVELTLSSPPAGMLFWFPFTCVDSFESDRGEPPFPLVSVAVTDSAGYGTFGANETWAVTPAEHGSSVKYWFDWLSAGHGPVSVAPPFVIFGAWPEVGAVVDQLLM